MPKQSKPRRRTQPSSKATKRPSGFIWLITGLALGLLIAGIIYLKKHQQPTSKVSASTKQKLISKKKQARKKPKFEFYTILPNAKVEVPKKTTKQQRSYTLQIASVKHYTDADRYKAQLTLAGYNVTISQAKIHQTNWYRVTLGPYQTLKAANQAQQQLRSQGIKSIILK